MIRLTALRDTMTIFTTTWGPGSGDAGRYGDPVAAESEGVVVRCSVRPFREKELENGQDRRVSTLRCIVSPQVNLDGLTRVEWHGRSYEVWGEPEPWVTRQGVHHLAFTIRGIEGF